MSQLSFHSPIGDLTVSEDGGALVAVDWGWSAEQTDTPLLVKARGQILEYLDGERRSFDLPLTPAGTAFQRRVWDAMQHIPYGRTASYGDLARQLGSAARAVGGACGRNPIPIVVPCHRVVSGTGLGGYSGEGGLATKERLLRLEGAQL